jgi:hypothetical protein
VRWESCADHPSDIVHPKPLVFTVQKTSDHGMTEEEERELAELMSDED